MNNYLSLNDLATDNDYIIQLKEIILFLLRKTIRDDTLIFDNTSFD